MFWFTGSLYLALKVNLGSIIRITSIGLKKYGEFRGTDKYFLHNNAKSVGEGPLFDCSGCSTDQSYLSRFWFQQSIWRAKGKRFG